jgi:acetyl esterase/lipase
VPLSPWLDATLSDPEVQDREASDPMLAESGLRAAGRWWAGRRDPRDPQVSPVRAGLTGLPPVHVFIGDRDILRPAVDDLAERVRAEGSDLHVHEVPAMFHVWMTRFIPEAARTRRELTRLVAAAGDPSGLSPGRSTG